MGKYFGTDGFRGEANKDLTYEHAIQIGRFLGWYYGARQGKKAKIVIGKDTRRSSYMFEYALCTGLVASGADAYIMHVTTTPSVAYITRVDEFDCGIMISASHNPFYDNGIKLFNGEGEKMPEETILEIEDYIDGKIEVPVAVREGIGRTVDYVSGRNRYIGHLISMSKYGFKDVKVGLDVANGAAWQIAKSVFDALGAKTYVMNDSPDGYNINTDCGSTHIEHLQKFVVENGLDIGFAYDGDAAGQHAILRGLDILREEGVPARVLDFPDGLDPDQYIRREGAEAFRSLPAISAETYRLRRLKDGLDLSTEEGRISYAREAARIIAPLDPVELKRKTRCNSQRVFIMNIGSDQIFQEQQQYQPREAQHAYGQGVDPVHAQQQELGEESEESAGCL